MKYIKYKQIIVLAGMLATAGVNAAEDRFSVSGFGYQDYRQTNANVQDGADRRGTWQNDIIALVISGKVSDANTVWAQLESTATESTAFTWAFIDHRFNDNLSAHVGRVKFPLGVYNEFVDNKWLQLGVVQPSIYAPAADFVHDAYTGIGIDWTAGSLFTQVYAGNNYSNPPDWQVTPTPSFADRRMIGGRITWNTPHAGLRLLASGYRTQVESTAGLVPGQGESGHEDRWIFSVDYVAGSFDIKGEYASHKAPELAGQSAVTSYASYIQGGYKIGLWTPFVRFDDFHADQSNTSDPGKYQKDQIIGISYTINENINARVEDHFIRGYGLTDGAALIPPIGKTDWNMIAAGINFIF